MELKKTLVIGFLSCSVLFTACSNSKPSGGGQKEKDNYSQILKDCGSKLLTLNNEHVPNRGFVPYDDAPAQALAMPGIYLYWSGLLEDIDGISLIDQAISFDGTYKFNGMGGAIQEINFDLSVHFDEDNNKFTFLGRQTLPAPYQYSYLILDCEYNFASKELGDFTILMQPAGFGSGNYMRYVDNRLYQYNYGSGDSHESDPDYITYSEIARNGINALETLIQTETVLEGSTLEAAKLAFKNASDYCDEVCEGVNFDVEIVEE